MADYRAVMAASEAVISLLRSNYRAEDFNNELEFKVFTSKDFTDNTILNGLSLFPYRVYLNGTHRSPAGNVGVNGERVKTKLPVEVHCLITLWGQEASLQNTLVGWVMRVLEDNPVLPSNLLNSAVSGVFRPDESVDVTLAELSTEDMFRIWDVLGINVYQLSIPYIFRVIEIDSIQQVPLESDSDVQEREFVSFTS